MNEDMYGTPSGRGVKKTPPKSPLLIAISIAWNGLWRHLRVVLVLLWVTLALHVGQGVVRLYRSDVGFVVFSEGCWVPKGKSKAFVALLVTGRPVGDLKLS